MAVLEQNVVIDVLIVKMEVELVILIKFRLINFSE